MKTTIKKIGVIGGGNMGQALIQGFVKSRIVKASHIVVSDPHVDKTNMLKRKYNITIVPNNKVLVQQVQTIFLVVKPKDIKNVLAEITRYLDASKILVSCAAGMKIKTIESFIKQQIPVVRIMPNLAVAFGKGVSAWTINKSVSKNQITDIKNLLQHLGKELFFKEEVTLDKITAISGSGPAYFYYLSECLEKAAINMGFSTEEAQILAYQTLIGASELLLQSKKTAKELRLQVTSPGGTTEAAMKIFDKNKLPNTIISAVQAAYNRARELST